MKWLNRKILIVAGVVVFSWMTACSNPGDSKSVAQTSTPKSTSTATVNFDPMQKYDPPIELSTVGFIDDTFKFADGDSIENNVWTRGYDSELGIKLKYLWVAKGADQGQTKLNVTLASGELPDLMQVNAVQLKQLIDAGSIADLTDVYAKYASPEMKDMLTQDGGIGMSAATFKGKLMAIPVLNADTDTSQLVWIRQDWLDKLNLPAPKTMADLLKITEAFTKQDPDGNGKADTFGLAVTKDLNGTGASDLQGFFNGYHAYPKTWIKTPDGKLAYGSIQPEMKDALKSLQQLFADGQIDKEFGVKDGGKVAESIAAGKIGVEFGQHWNSFWPLADAVKNNPKAVWRVYPIVSVDDKPLKVQVSAGASNFYVVSKKAKHPEAAIKIANFSLLKGFGKSATKATWDTYMGLPKSDKYPNGIELFKYASIMIAPPRKNLDLYNHITEARKNNDTSKLRFDELTVYDHQTAGLNGDKTHWDENLIFGKNGAQSIINNYVTNGMLLPGAFYGAPTPSMVKSGNTKQTRE